MIRLKNKLDETYGIYHDRAYLKMDPLWVVHKFKGKRNIEISGLLCSALAYGRVERIIESLERLFSITGANIEKFTRETSFKKKCKLLSEFKHRFNDGVDIALLLQGTKIAIEKYGSIEYLFLEGLGNGDLHIGNTLHKFGNFFKQQALILLGTSRKYFEYLFPSPLSGSACKRLNMYLRWMVRKNDGIDFGLWPKIPVSSLIMPVDTHVAGIARRWGLTSKKTPSWQMAVEITEALKNVEPSDPLKYDFSICQAGMNQYRREFTNARSN